VPAAQFYHWVPAFAGTTRVEARSGRWNRGGVAAPTFFDALRGSCRRPARGRAVYGAVPGQIVRHRQTHVSTSYRGRECGARYPVLKSRPLGGNCFTGFPPSRERRRKSPSMCRSIRLRGNDEDAHNVIPSLSWDPSTRYRSLRMTDRCGRPALGSIPFP
jgi:hypothetical protein